MPRRGSKRLRISKKEIIEWVLDYTVNHPRQELNNRLLSHYFRIKDRGTQHLLEEVLDTLTHQGYLRRVAYGSYRLAQIPKEGVGIFSSSSFSAAAQVTLKSGEVIDVEWKKGMHVLEGDKVRVLYYPARRGEGFVGRILAIEERAREYYVGTLYVQGRAGYVVPSGRFPFKAIAVGYPTGGKRQEGLKVRVRLLDWAAGAYYPEGEIVEILGQSGMHEVEMHAILAEFNLPYTYPDAVTSAAEKLPNKITTKEIASRRDFRGECTFTIDPATAKDFDDALSIKLLSGGRCEVGVHIADVTHYVQEGDIINEEARNRGTSVYLVDRTVPMLPERLCNDLCSLRPDEDKLTYSILFEMDEAGNVISQWIGRSIIRSQQRFTYEEVQAVIDGGASPYSSAIHSLNHLAQRLRAMRFQEGAIDFSTQEVRFQLDAKGVPMSVEPVPYTESHQLIEEFMLLANRTVAQFVSQARSGTKEYPFVYRVHAKPREEKLESFLRVVAKLGVPYKGDRQKFDGKALVSILAAFCGRKEEHFVGMLAIRSMEKAIYSTQNIGHFGLAFEYYTHFTSPIRRYPDMMVHRLLTAVLAQNDPSKERMLESACKLASDQEKTAADAERASIKYKQVEYLSHRLGQCFLGFISGIAEYGFYVELDASKCEGMVNIRDLRDDLYHYYAEEYCLRGSRTGREYRLGDVVRIRVVRTDLEKRIVDFELTE
ncbi:MAG: ribonuclease R [Bacteroides sp.]